MLVFLFLEAIASRLKCLLHETHVHDVDLTVPSSKQRVFRKGHPGFVVTDNQGLGCAGPFLFLPQISLPTPRLLEILLTRSPFPGIVIFLISRLVFLPHRCYPTYTADRGCYVKTPGSTLKDLAFSWSNRIAYTNRSMLL